MSKIYTKKDLIEDFNKLGVQKGDLLNVKVSLKSIGYQIDGGAKTLVEALLETIGEEGTIVTDSFVTVFPIKKLLRDKSLVSTEDTPSYAGAIANAMVSYTGRYRSRHPVQRFVCIGKLAKQLTENHKPESYAYDVLRVMAENGGKNLKIGTDEKVVGVGTTHVAIGKLGLKQKRQDAGIWYYDNNNQLKLFRRNWAGLCANGLVNFVPFYDKAGAVISRGKVGQSDCKITNMKKTLDVEIDLLQKDPTFFMCKSKYCIECQLSWSFSKGNFGRLALNIIARKKIREFIRLVRYSTTKKLLQPSS